VKAIKLGSYLEEDLKEMDETIKKRAHLCIEKLNEVLIRAAEDNEKSIPDPNPLFGGGWSRGGPNPNPNPNWRRWQ